MAGITESVALEYPDLIHGVWGRSYIESHGTEYIDSGYKISSENIELSTTFQKTNTETRKTLCGSQDNYNENTGNYGALVYYCSEYGGFGFLSGNKAMLGYQNVSVLSKHTLTGISNNGICTVTIDEQTTSYTYSRSLISTLNRTWYIFSTYDNILNHPTETGEYKLYNISLKDNTILQRYYLPVRDKSGEVGMFDIVEGKFYGNNGTGTFTFGLD